MQRLTSRAQFEAVLSGGATVARTAHFALHRARPAPRTAPAGDTSSTGPGSPDGAQALFAVQAAVPAPAVGVVVPKRWARRAVTRNAIRRQIYAVSLDFEAALPAASHVVRLRAGFDRKAYPSAWSEALRRVVRAELQQLFAGARR